MAENRATEPERVQPPLTIGVAYRRFGPRLLVVIALLGLAIGAWFWWRGGPSNLAWTLGTLPVLLALFGQIVSSLRRGDVGLDVVAALSMSAALFFGESLAGNVVALMYAGGQLLESFAEGRARREMTALLGRVAFTAMRYCDHTLEEAPIATIRQGDRLLVRQGDVVPVNGHVADGVATLDLSALTGESIPKNLSRGGEVMSGSTLVGAAFDLIASRSAAESTYAGIVRIVGAAQASKSPMARLADRYAIGFLMLTVFIAAAAWLLSGDPIRALAVLVVATPCPLILAVPVAIISDISPDGEIGSAGEGWCSSGRAGACANRDPGQDGHSNTGPPHDHRYQNGRRVHRARRARPSRKPRSSVGACHGDIADSGGDQRRHHASASLEHR